MELIIMDIDKYVQKRSMNLSDTTLKSHKSALKRFEQITGISNREPTVDDVDEYIDQVSMNNLYSDTSLKQNLNILKMYFQVMRLGNVDELETLLRTRSPTVSSSQYKHEYYSKEDIMEVIDNSDYPWNLYFALTYTFARRLMEVALLENRDVKEDYIRFNIVKKPGDYRKKLSRDMLKLEWDDWLSKRKKETTGKLFSECWEGNNIKRNIPQYRLVQFGRRSGVIGEEDRMSVHSLRHSRARHLLDEEGVSPRALKDGLLFHEQLSTTTDTYGTKEDAEDVIPGV